MKAGSTEQEYRETRGSVSNLWLSSIAVYTVYNNVGGNQIGCVFRGQRLGAIAGLTREHM